MTSGPNRRVAAEFLALAEFDAHDVGQSRYLRVVLPASIPSPDPVWSLIPLGPLTIHTYALCLLAGIAAAAYITDRRLRARGAAPGLALDIAMWAVPIGIVGARIYHVLTHLGDFTGPNVDPWAWIRIWEGGNALFGSLLGGAVGVWIGCRLTGLRFWSFADALAPGLLAAQAIGRLGNYVNQELFGLPTTLPWGLEIYRRVDPATGITDPLAGVAVDHTPIAVVQPTFLYELLRNLLVAGLVVWADRRFRLGHGRAFAVYVAGYTLGRFFIELLRTDPATRVFGDIRINVVVAGVVYAGAIAYLLLVRKPREVPPFPPRVPRTAAVLPGRPPAHAAESAGPAAVEPDAPEALRQPAPAAAGEPPEGRPDRTP